MSERLHEVALTREEVDRILSVCGTHSLLVGGQALAFWASHYGVVPIGVLSASVTSDVDFVGTSRVAELLRKSLNWNIWIPTMDDATEQTAKVTAPTPGGGVKQVDFLRAIVGLDTDGIQARAVEVTLPSGALVRILHPLDVLESRLRNLQTPPSKRNPAGIAQAVLAISIVGAFLQSLLACGDETRTILDAVERVLQMALDKRLAKWPQVLAATAEFRRKYAARESRRT